MDHASQRGEQRFGDVHDSRDALRYLSDFARAVPAFALQLSPRLADLARLVDELAQPAARSARTA